MRVNPKKNGKKNQFRFKLLLPCPMVDGLGCAIRDAKDVLLIAPLVLCKS